MEKILIVEDDEAIAQIYKIALTHRNHEAEIAIDGIEGVEKAKTIHPKLILLDIMMPRKNGVEVMEDLKADPSTANIPVFILSNLVDLEMIDKMKKFGALKYLVKSQYTPDQIVDIVEEFFKNPSSAASPSQQSSTQMPTATLEANSPTNAIQSTITPNAQAPSQPQPTSVEVVNPNNQQPINNTEQNPPANNQ